MITSSMYHQIILPRRLLPRPTLTQVFRLIQESSLPTAPSHYPSYHHCHDSSYLQHSAQQLAPSVPDYPSAAQYSLGGRNESHAEPERTPDPNYQPPPEKIAEAHKAARFAVGALAFDDVAVAVDFLGKSLELLTDPSASTSR
ncbi:LOW QUALITY PROTEIN: Vta1, C-terminal [Dillenia turbinata]|uniref:Vta1, C-terminal n=1 Tax=Dillenia turbinata TaxID=194707 RepID=A0AAN8UX78_9MAGN